MKIVCIIGLVCFIAVYIGFKQLDKGEGGEGCGKILVILLVIGLIAFFILMASEAKKGGYNSPHIEYRHS